MCCKANIPSIKEEEIDIEQPLSTEDILAISQEIIVRNRKAYTELAQSNNVSFIADAQTQRIKSDADAGRI